MAQKKQRVLSQEEKERSQELIEALIRESKISGPMRLTPRTNEFFFSSSKTSCRPLLCKIIKEVFDSGSYVEYDDLVSELYLYLMKDGAKKLKAFRYESSFNTWLTLVATRFFIKIRDKISGIPTYEKPEDRGEGGDQEPQGGEQKPQGGNEPPVEQDPTPNGPTGDDGVKTQSTWTGTVEEQGDNGTDVQQNEAAMVVEQLLKQINPRYATVIRLMFLKDLSPAEILADDELYGQLMEGDKPLNEAMLYNLKTRALKAMRKVAKEDELNNKKVKI